MLKYYHFNILLSLIIYLELLSDILSVIRLFQLFNTTLITRYFIVLPFLFVFLITIKYLDKIKFDFFSIFLLFIAFYGIILSLFNFESTEFINYEFYYILSEYSTIIFAFFAYVFVYNINFNCDYEYKLENFLFNISKTILIVNIFNIFLVYFFNYFTSYQSYLSVSGKLLLIPFIWFFLNNKYKASFLSLLVIFFGGKFGVLVSGIFILTFLIKYKYKIHTFIFSFIQIFIFLLGIFFLYLIKDISSIGVINKINNNYNIFNIDFDNLIHFGGGRLIELFSVFKEYDYLEFLMGRGLGFEYLDIVNLQFIHNVHITPFGLISKIGLVMLCLLSIFIIFKILLRVKNDDEEKFLVFFKLLFVSMLFFSLTEYAFFINLTIWVSLGYISNRSRKCVG